MRIGDVVEVKPHGGPKHVGIITTIDKDIVYCTEWYSLNVPNCVMGCSFYKEILKVVDKKLFTEAKERWENRPEPVIEK